MEIKVIQFIPPRGRTRIAVFDISDKLEFKYLMMQRCDCQITAEHLATGEFSVTISHPCYGDYAIEITENLSKVPRLLENMLELFNEDEFDVWQKTQ